jgi:tetratricopeptide (TPR) repeat protein
MSFESQARRSSHAMSRSNHAISRTADRSGRTKSEVHTRPDSLTQNSAELEPGLELPTESIARSRGAEPAAEERQTKLTPGTVIADTRLEIIRWLGEGGMGTVFEVRHLDIDRHFAVKLLHRSESVARARRFRREAKTIGNIGSPWVVEIFDFKELPDGRLMYLMELVDGPSLLDRQRERGTLEFARLIGLARQICKGLTDAHARGFIHRDIKPENIMLATDSDGREHVKIVDFGLAGLLAEPNESSRAGTPAYMSPEQCKGEPADARTDIYSLGVTLYELACGTLPFVRETADAVRDDHVRKQPVPPSSVDHSLPRRFDALVLRCLAKHPERRFANAAELEAALIELQLELGLQTEWDDLPAPPVERRPMLELGLDNLRRNQQRERARRTLFGFALASLIAISSALGWWIGAEARSDAVAQAKADVEALREAVRQAANERRWVYPSAEQPEETTAYGLLLELESLDVDAAHDVGQQLRQELANQLLAHGDAYWNKPGGRSFAREFYAHVLVFEPDNARALARAGLSRSAVAALRERAATGQFDEFELDAMAPLAALTEPDEQARLKALVEISEDPEQLPSSVALSIDQLIAGLRGDQPKQAGEPLEYVIDPVEITAEPFAVADDVELEQAPSESSSKPAPSKKSARAEAAMLATQGDEAYESGQRDEAERLYQRSLQLDGDNLAALIGLHRINFDHGQFKDALAYAKQALALRPKRSDLNLYVGDSCMKVLDYNCARSHYEHALELGSKQASQRLRMLDERLGTPHEGGP